MASYREQQMKKRAAMKSGAIMILVGLGVWAAFFFVLGASGK